jgi:hypothetical protein
MITGFLALVKLLAMGVIMLAMIWWLTQRHDE